MSPFCDWLVTFFPTWLAPNVITLAGFAVNVVVHLLMLYIYGTSTEGPIAPWFLVLLGLGFTVYNIMDNCDGK